MKFYDTVYNKYIEKVGDDFEKIANNIIESKEGVLILGPAGTGKSCLIKNIIDKIKDKKHAILTPTNKSAI